MSDHGERAAAEEGAALSKELVLPPIGPPCGEEVVLARPPSAPPSPSLSEPLTPDFAGASGIPATEPSGAPPPLEVLVAAGGGDNDDALQLRVASLQEAFAGLDPKGDGSLGKKEVRSLLKQGGWDFPTEDVRNFFAAVGATNRHARIPFVDLVRFMLRPGRARPGPAPDLLVALRQTFPDWRGSSVYRCHTDDNWQALRRVEGILCLHFGGICQSWRRTLSIVLDSLHTVMEWEVFEGKCLIEARDASGRPSSVRCMWSRRFRLTRSADHSPSASEPALDAGDASWIDEAAEDSSPEVWCFIVEGSGDLKSADTGRSWHQLAPFSSDADPIQDRELELPGGSFAQLQTLLAEMAQKEEWQTPDVPEPPLQHQASMDVAYTSSNSATLARDDSVLEGVDGGRSSKPLMEVASEHISYWSQENDTPPRALLRRYSVFIMRCPLCCIFVYLLCVIILVYGAWHPFQLNTDFSAFIQADGNAQRNQQALVFALAKQKDLNDDSGRRRLTEEELELSSVSGTPVRLRRHSSRGVPSRAAEDEREDIWLQANSTASLRGGQERHLATRAVIYIEMELNLIYDALGGNGLDERVLREVRDFELSLRALPGWSKVCISNWLCDPGQSLAAIAWPSQTVSAFGQGMLFDLTFDGRGSELLALPAMLNYMQRAWDSGNGDASRDPRRYFPKDYDLPSTLNTEAMPEGGPSAIKTTFKFQIDVGINGDTYEKVKQGIVAAQAQYTNFVEEGVYPLLLKAPEVYEHIKIYYYGNDILGYEVQRTLQQDLFWAMGSLLFVACYTCFHTKSVLLTVSNLLVIFSSIPVAYVLTPAEKTTIASFLAVFLITGIGVDSVFVFMDFWAQARKFREVDTRLVFLFVHAGKSCFATSSTTAMSFLANLASVLQPLREFGMFMGLCVLSAYVLLLLILPPLLVWKERRRSTVRHRTVDITSGEISTLAVVPGGVPPPSSGGGEAVEIPGLTPGAASGRKYSILFNLVTLTSHCPILIAVTTGLFVLVSIIGITVGAEVDTGIPEIFPPEHNQVYGKKLSAEFNNLLPVKTEPSIWGYVCDASSMDTQHGCTMHWCDAASSSAGGDSYSGECWRSPTMLSSGSGLVNVSWSTEGCTDILVRSRFTWPDAVAPVAWPSKWLTTVASMLNVSEAVFQGDTAPLASLGLESWETGEVEMSRFFQSANVLGDGGHPIVGAPQCRVHTLCFFGTSRCKVSGWQSMGLLNLTTPSTAAVATESMGRRLHVRERWLPRRLASFTPTVPARKRMQVEVVFGIRTPLSTPIVGPIDLPWSFDPTFEPQNPWAQRAMYAICSELSADLRVVEGRCWISELRSWLQSSNRGHLNGFPSRDFDNDLIGWYISDPIAGQQDLWMVKRQMKACRLSFRVDVNEYTSADSALDYMAYWDAFIDAKNKAASVTANHAWHTSSVWVRAEAEIAVIGSTELTIVLSAVCSGLGMLMFTGDPWITFLVLTLVLGITCGLGFFMIVIMGWKVGPIEVISLVVFVGYSVTYSLHIGHDYCRVQENDLDLQIAEDHAARKLASRAEPGVEFDGVREPLTARGLRLARARVAVLRMGGATLSSAASTVGSSIFLLCCTLNIFGKLGAVVIAVTVISTVFALVALPAALILFGPGPKPCYRKLLEDLAERVHERIQEDRLARRRTMQGPGLHSPKQGKLKAFAADEAEPILR